MKKLFRKAVLFFTLWTTIVFASDEEKAYRPYPIIFVHGYAANESVWDYSKDKLEIYFWDDNLHDFKYDFKIREHYYPHVNYGSDNNGDVRNIARIYLKPAIDLARERMALMNPPVPESKRKVIIVAHSYGGLITRSLIKQFPECKNYVEKVVFVGTPHLGSPLASVIWLVNQEINGSLKDNLKVRLKLYENYGNNILGILTDDLSAAYKEIASQIKKSIKVDEDLLKDAIRGGTQPGGLAINRLRVPADVTLKREFKARIGTSLFANYAHYIYTVSYLANDTFLRYRQTLLGIPNKYNLIVGKSAQLLGWFLQWKINKGGVVFLGFPIGNDLEDLDEGDGVVTLASQNYLSRGSVYEIHSSHGEEKKRYKDILKAIDDDPPEVVKIYAVPKYWLPKNANEAEQYYIIIGCKEYLLADVEVVDLTLDGEDINPFSEGKPYNTFGKDFLKEREVEDIKDAAGKSIKLKPGEFYVLANIPSGLHTLKVQLRNPAQKIKGERGAKPVVVQFSRPKVESTEFTNCKGGCYYDWTVDVPIYDEQENEDHIDYIGNYGSLSFSVKSELFQDIVLNVKIYNYESNSAYVGPKSVMKTLVKARSIRLNSIGNNVYQSSFPSQTISENELTWDGSKGNGGYVIEHRSYPVQILVYSQDRSGMEPPFNINNSTGRQGLYGSNWDDGYWNDLIIADPTFVQYNRQAEVPIGLNLKLELLGMKLDYESDDSDIESIKNECKIYLETKLIPLLEAVIKIEQQNLESREALMELISRHKINPDIAKWILAFANYRSNVAIFQIKERIRDFFRNISGEFQGVFINKATFSFNYKASHSSKSVKIDINEKIS